MEGSWRGGGGTGMVFQFAAASGSGNIRRSAKTKKSSFYRGFFYFVRHASRGRVAHWRLLISHSVHPLFRISKEKTQSRKSKK
ncbi:MULTISPECIES: hypothetical protein [Achromobacter]|uniref:hypothetical protein n=1 Tax=Achromobacter TaxID=222 RepID=UPI0012E0F90B|nr:hypothetical protein [Achromobacter sp. 2789STDY5608615]MCG2598662.1 hypothetical protein [Achromobacter sp.]MCG2603984.1 hypothetical protein [Achromobacter sp.]